MSESSARMSKSGAGIAHFPHAELFMWIAPLAAIFLVAAFLRLVDIDRDRPVTTDSDEPYYYLWARSIRETGRPDYLDGSGYPPGFLYLLIGEQRVVEIFNGGAPDTTYDYFALARTVNAILGAAAMMPAAYLARSIGRSRSAGLAAGLYITLWTPFVFESRRATANAPWLFVTLLALLLLVRSRGKRSFAYLNLAVVLGIMSFLFKYQSGVILVLPFVFGALDFRADRFRLIGHFAAWSVILAGLLAWLIFDYGILEIVNTPDSATASGVADGRLVGLQSVPENWALLASASGSKWIVWGAVAAFALAGFARVFPGAAMPIESRGVLALFIFIGLYFVVMSFFVQTHASKWLPVLASLLILASAALVAYIRLAIKFLLRNQPRWRQRAANLTPALALVVIGWPFLVEQGQHWRWTYRNDWSRPLNLVLLNEWFDANVPQGGRVIAEANKMVNNYPGAPAIFHNGIVASIFDEPISAYRERGYEYLVWNSMKSTPTDSLADLDAPERDAALQDAQEVLRLTGEDGVGMDIVVFAIDPLPTNELYAWFGETVSFRGYDISHERTAAGVTVTVTLYWMSVAVTDSDLVVFVHLMNGETRELVGQHDGPPGNGFDNTWKWSGDMQLHIDPHVLTLGDEATDGEYDLRIGMYDAVTLERANVRPVSAATVVEDNLVVVRGVRLFD